MTWQTFGLVAKTRVGQMKRAYAPDPETTPARMVAFLIVFWPVESIFNQYNSCCSNLEV